LTLLPPWDTQLKSSGTLLPDYPRTQLQRDAWINLNGQWGSAAEATLPATVATS
jgi:hypothetical protein